MKLDILFNYDNYKDDCQKIYEESLLSKTTTKDILVEGIEEVKKYFPKISDQAFNTLIGLDPTYKGGDQLGKYGKWLLGLWNNHLKNVKAEQDYDNFIKKNPSGINPKTGNPIVKPELLPEITKEDFPTVKQMLASYDRERVLNKNINNIKSYKELTELVSQSALTGIKFTKNSESVKSTLIKSLQKGFKIIFKNQNWVVGIPETFESSKCWAELTNWCTTRTSDTYSSYTYRGPLYILIETQYGFLYQIHWQRNEFRDGKNVLVGRPAFWKSNKDLATFFYTMGLEQNIKDILDNEEIAASIATNQELAKQVYEKYMMNEDVDIFSIPPVLLGVITTYRFKNTPPNEFNKLEEIFGHNFSKLQQNYRWQPFYNTLASEMSDMIDKLPTIVKCFPVITHFLKYDQNIKLLEGVISCVVKMLKKGDIPQIKSDNISIYHNEIGELNDDRYVKIYEKLINDVSDLSSKDNKDFIFNLLHKFDSGILKKFSDEIILKASKLSPEVGDKWINYVFFGNIVNTYKPNNQLIKKGAQLIKEMVKNGIEIPSRIFYREDEFKCVFGELKKNDEMLPYIIKASANADISIGVKKLLYKNLPFKYQKILFKNDIPSFTYVDKPDKLIQRLLINKNIYNVRYINNLDPKLKKELLKKEPDIKYYIKGYDYDNE